jgi:hypothetical protein
MLLIKGGIPAPSFGCAVAVKLQAECFNELFILVVIDSAIVSSESLRCGVLNAHFSRDLHSKDMYLSYIPFFFDDLLKEY